jgi:predicted PurR-regulated permease PerM
VDHSLAIKRILAGILLLMSFATIYFTKDILLPVVIGLLLAATLSPLVRGAERYNLSPPISALLLIMTICVAIAVAVLFLGGSVAAWVDQAPQLGDELREKLSSVTASVEAVQNASEQMESITDSAGPVTQKVVVDQPGLLTTAVSNLAAFTTSMIVGIILALFLLASGDMFFIKLVQSFPNLSDKKRAVKIVYDIQRRISHYLLSITLINAGLGVSIAGVLFLIGLPYWWLWGFVAFSFNFLPFLGAIIGSMLVGAYSIVTFDELGYALLAPAAYLTLTSIEGQLVTPFLLGRRLDINTVSVFLTVIFWGWLWGIPGALMAVPFLVCLKVICDHVDSMKTLGNFLSSGAPPVVEDPAPVAAE